jgi:hypothetical protein
LQFSPEVTTIARQSIRIAASPMRDILSRFDVCSLSVVALIGWLLVHKVEEHFQHYVRTMRGFAAAGFLATAVYGFVDAQPVREDVVGLGIVSLISAGAASLAAILVVPPLKGLRDLYRSWAFDRRLAAERRAEEARKEREQQERDLTWERERPERERQERQWEAERQAAAAAKKRRDDVRAECLLYFHLHSPEFGTRFGRKQFDEYVKTYMGDDQPPQEVEQRAQRLLGLMEGHLEKAGVKQRPFDVGSLARWYEEQKATIEAQRLPEESKENALALLYERYETLMQRHLEELKP